MEAEEEGSTKLTAENKSLEELKQSDPVTENEEMEVIEGGEEEEESGEKLDMPDLSENEDIESVPKANDNGSESGDLESGKEISSQEEEIEGEVEAQEEDEEEQAEAMTQEIEDTEEGMVQGEEEETEETAQRQDEIEEEEGELEIDEGLDDVPEDSETIDKTCTDGTDALSKDSSGGMTTRKRTLSQSSGEDGPKRKVGRNVGGVVQANDGAKHDKYCWVCHKDGVQVNCKLCPRSYHIKCMSVDYPNSKIDQNDSTCPCPECVVVMNAETLEFRSDAMKQVTLDQLMGLLKNVCIRMRQTPGAEPFIKPVDTTEAVDYYDFIVYPMDIETLERNIKKRLYGSTEGFLADAQWIVHNSIVFNSASSSYSQFAKRILKVCKAELGEIEICPECYTNAYDNDKNGDWFVLACRRPHILVWAKLKGFPFWPAKAVKIQTNDTVNTVDVRFFGQHDRAWVAIKDCFLYSEEMPVAPPKKSGPLQSAIEELNAHVEKLKEIHGPVVFAQAKTQIGPQLNTEQIRRMLPEYNPPELQPKAQSTPSSTSKANTNAANNNNNTTKAPQPPKKSPMTIRISSLKTNPTIVNNSAVAGDGTGASPDGRVVTRLTRKSSAATQNQSAGLAESDNSTDEQQTADANPVDEQNAGSVPDNTNGTDEDEATAPAVSKNYEILEKALGGPLRRSTRAVSRSGDISTQAAEPGTPSANEKRLTRSALRGSTPDAGNETDESSGQIGDEQPPDSVLEAMGLSKKTSKDPPPTGQRVLQIKGEPADHFNDTDGEQADVKQSNKNSHALVEQLSAHTTVKPGYRFNLSKDISISAVDGGGGGGGGGVALTEQADESPVAANLKIRRANPIMGQNQRGVPQAIPMGVAGNIRPRVQSNNSSILNGQQQHPRTFTGQQLRQMVRNAKPQHILNPRTGQTIRVAGPVPGNRPVSLLNMRGQQQQQIVQKAAKEVNVDSSLVSPVQGPITLPGGTITVTPLTSLINSGAITAFDGQHVAQAGQHVALSLKSNPSTSGLINVQQQGGGGSVMVNNAAAGKSMKGGITSNQQRRNLMASIPPSVSLHLQQLTKTMGDLVKSTVEQITLEVIEHCNNTQGKAEATRLQVEVDRLQNKLKQEVTDVKHNNDIALRELRITMENDKKRAITELKRQMEADKQKIVEETKKKQWCASCGREALFYCCWNTSYCGYPCQEEHWPNHMSSCSQGSGNAR